MPKASQQLGVPLTVRGYKFTCSHRSKYFSIGNASSPTTTQGRSYSELGDGVELEILSGLASSGFLKTDPVKSPSPLDLPYPPSIMVNI